MKHTPSERIFSVQKVLIRKNKIGKQ